MIGVLRDQVGHNEKGISVRAPDISHRSLCVCADEKLLITPFFSSLLFHQQSRADGRTFDRQYVQLQNELRITGRVVMYVRCSKRNLIQRLVTKRL
jgi:hypothetical protein